MSDEQKPDNVVKLDSPKRGRGTNGLHPKPGRIARARKILLDDPLPPAAELEREAVNGLRQIIRDESCIENARVGAIRVMLEYVEKLEKGGAQHEPQTAEDFEAIERWAGEMKGKVAG